MPIDPRRRDDIVAAVAAYDSANPSAPLPRNAARLLAVMFATEDVCQRSLEDIAAEGFGRKTLPACCGALVEAGFLSQAAGLGARARTPTGCICRRCSHEAPPPREGVRPRPRRAAGPQRQGPHCRLRARLERPEPPAGPTQAARSPAPSWTCWRRCCGASTTPAPAAASRSYEAIAAKAECARSTVAEALKALEWVLSRLAPDLRSWQHGIGFPRMPLDGG